MNTVSSGHWAGWQVGEGTGLTAPEPDNGTRGLARRGQVGSYLGFLNRTSSLLNEWDKMRLDKRNEFYAEV